jgi:hypothetical protein
MGLRFGVASDQLSAQHHSRSNSDFTQHWITFLRFWHWVGSNSGPQRVLTFICDVNVSTEPRERPHNTYAIFRDFWPPLLRNAKPYKSLYVYSGT